ncbi:hypothetical protein C2845_PM12G21070 [Panicum miliaceum]|uniref:Uncharacterized protein n=1 Tax=Panicum miliaceum TaxID=4540 RepID=A0A3L6QHK1_PANMI|nr:hypothetical protein C2845_PM12G21070 [Panicum miliaceum]
MSSARSRCLAAPPVKRTRVPAEWPSQSKAPRPFQPRSGGERARPARQRATSSARASGWAGGVRGRAPQVRARGDARAPAPPDGMEEDDGAVRCAHCCAVPRKGEEKLAISPSSREGSATDQITDSPGGRVCRAIRRIIRRGNPVLQLGLA